MDNRDLVKRQFGAHAENYVVSSDHATSDSLERLTAVVPFEPGWRALDIATGGGHTALAVARRVQSVVATDLTPEMLAAAEGFIRGQGQANVTFREADAQALPFAAAEFDLATCRIAPHHFPDCARFVREMARVLRPGGYAVLIDNTVPADPGAARHINAFEQLRDPSHHWAHTESDWLDFFAAAGLVVRHQERFRKARDFDDWTGMMGAPPAVKDQLRVMLLQAPAAAREALAPANVEGRLKFYLTEIMLLAQKPA
ncbi:MAG: class I SAM-dependent methyltransferase [Anaerolineales bacterium]|nr:class I SAM-dependent methyltransferase [Anaerolineales bacterium]